jgi:hypothetical protein
MLNWQTFLWYPFTSFSSSRSGKCRLLVPLWSLNWIGRRKSWWEMRRLVAYHWGRASRCVEDHQTWGGDWGKGSVVPVLWPTAATTKICRSVSLVWPLSCVSSCMPLLNWMLFVYCVCAGLVCFLVGNSNSLTCVQGEQDRCAGFSRRPMGFVKPVVSSFHSQWMGNDLSYLILFPPLQ